MEIQCFGIFCVSLNKLLNKESVIWEATALMWVHQPLCLACFIANNCRQQLPLECQFEFQIVLFLSGLLFTVGSFNADILRYNADNLSTTLNLWGKFDENVSWVNTFPSHSPTYFYFTQQNIAYRVTSMSMHATAQRLSTHIVSSRRNGCHNLSTCLHDTVRSALILREISIAAGIANVHDVILYQMWSVSIVWIASLFSCFHRTQHWKCEVRFSLSLSCAGTISRWKT